MKYYMAFSWQYSSNSDRIDGQLISILKNSVQSGLGFFADYMQPRPKQEWMDGDEGNAKQKSRPDWK